MAYMDIREYINRLEREGEIIRINKEVDWNLEMGAIIRRSHELGAPAPLAENIKDYPGWKLVGGIMGGSVVNGRSIPYRRINIALGIDPDSSPGDTIEEYIKRRENPIKPIEIRKEDAKCKENVFVGDKVDLFSLPAPLIHDGDGGRYAATWHATINKDPETGWVNWGMYRAHILTKNLMAGLFLPFAHGPLIYRKYLKENKPMPVSIAINSDPFTLIVASSYLEPGVNEVDIAGGLAQEPIKLVKCETNDLLVPADSEVVLEGEMLPGLIIEEGPFGEYTGFRVTERTTVHRVVYKINAITYRNNPIFGMSCMGMPIDDYATIGALSISSETMRIFRAEKFPVKAVYSPPYAGTVAIYIATEVPYANFSHTLASRIWGSRIGSYTHWIYVVPSDVNIYDPEKILHSIGYRCHPKNGIRKYEHIQGMVLDPFLSQYERIHGLGAGVVVDCTWPTDWELKPIESSFEGIYPKEIQEKVLNRWKKDYGYKE
jgi:4-hydroxy-3-polyprenylbenzoate decarboxylase